jgi:hypothetical protein
MPVAVPYGRLEKSVFKVCLLSRENFNEDYSLGSWTWLALEWRTF